MRCFRILLFFIFFIHVSAFSQKIIFCEKVDTYGHPQDSSDEFTITGKGGYFQMLVKLNKKLMSYNVVFDVYRIENNKEILENSLPMRTLPSLTWFYKEVTFYKKGNYVVYVYNEKDQMVAVGKVNILMR